MIEILKRIRDNLLSGDVEFALDKLDKLIDINEKLERSIVSKPFDEYCFGIDDEFCPWEDEDYPVKSSWWICHYKYYLENKCIEDCHQSIKIPAFDQVQESLFHTEMSEDHARSYLESLGMIDIDCLS